MADTHGLDESARAESGQVASASGPSFAARVKARLGASPRLRNRLLGFGLLSLGFYVTLFSFSDTILAVYSQGGVLVALLPVVLAFAASLIHGTFTSYLWEALGVTAQQNDPNGGRSR